MANGAVARQLAEARGMLRSQNINFFPSGIAEKAIVKYLTSPSWEVRNIGVKLIPRLGNPTLFDLLPPILTDHSESGIVRRNAATAICHARHWNDISCDAIERSLRDRYWEVRSEALHSLAALAKPSEHSEALILSVLFGGHPAAHEKGPADVYRRSTLRERNFEVRAACAHALGALAVSEQSVEALSRLLADSVWIVRYQATIALAEFAARNDTYKALAADRIRKVQITPECSVSKHPFGQTVSRLGSDVLKGTLSGHPEELRHLYLNLKKGWNIVDD